MTSIASLTLEVADTVAADGALPRTEGSPRRDRRKHDRRAAA
ncbi:hypothetical protein [Streptosporangium carneum]|nr:hypothetical protein [Streptosporangium carneum]